MGHRANLILVENNEHRRYYCHWGSISIPDDFFWGPEYARPFIERQRPEEQFWLDQIWAEGGVVMDVDHRMLLLWGGDHLLHDIPLRRVYLELLQEVWAGWTVHWAYNGVFDLVDYLELPRSLVESDFDWSLIDRPAVFARPKAGEWGVSVGSVRFGDGRLRLFPLASDVGWRLEKGPGMILKLARKQAGVASLNAGEWSDSFLHSGFHIDEQKKTVGFWAAHAPGAVMRIGPQWPGWQVEWWRDAFEFHLAEVGEALSLPVAAAEASLARLEEKFLKDNRIDMAALLLKLAGNDMLAAADIQINPDALEQDAPEVPAEVRRGIWDKAVEGWRAQRGVRL